MAIQDEEVGGNGRVKETEKQLGWYQQYKWDRTNVRRDSMSVTQEQIQKNCSYCTLVRVNYFTLKEWRAAFTVYNKVCSPIFCKKEIQYNQNNQSIQGPGLMTWLVRSDLRLQSTLIYLYVYIIRISEFCIFYQQIWLVFQGVIEIL